MNADNDGFELLEVIGSGGFGTVHRAHQSAFSRDVAVKIISTRLTDQSSRSRFDRECRALGLLSGHPNIVNVFGAGISDDDRPYLVMEYLPGGTLDDRLRHQGRMAWQEAAEVGAKLASALQTAHERGVLHRDLKPSNVLLSEWGEPKLADFGIARIAGEQLTQSQAVTASLLYAAPEILRGDTPTEAADIYALATTIHTLMAGRAAFSGTTDESPLAIISRVGMQDPPDLREHRVPAKVADVIARAMSKQPDERFTSAIAFGRALADAADIATDGVAAPVIRDDQTTRFAPPSATDPIQLADGDATTVASEPTPAPHPTGEHGVAPPPPPATGPVPAAATGSAPVRPPADEAPAATGPGAAAQAAGATAGTPAPPWATAPRALHGSGHGSGGRGAAPLPAATPGGSPGQGRGLVVAVTALAVLVVAGLGFTLANGGGDEPVVDGSDPTEQPADDQTTDEATDEPTDETTTDDPTEEPTEEPTPDEPTEEPTQDTGPLVEDPQALLEASLLTDAEIPDGYAFDGRDASDDPGPGFGETFCNVSDPRNGGTSSLVDSDVSWSEEAEGNAILQDVAVFESEAVAAAYYDAVIAAAATCESFIVDGDPPFDWTFTAGPESAGFGDQDNLWFADLTSQGIAFDSRVFFLREGPVVSTMIAFGLDGSFDDADASTVFASGTLKINQAVQAAGL